VEQYSALYTLATILWRGKEPDQLTVQCRSASGSRGEYQFNKALEELTVAYSWMKRTDTATAPYDTHDGQLVRFQLQWNY
jgi:hypothetical protein